MLSNFKFLWYNQNINVISYNWCKKEDGIMSTNQECILTLMSALDSTSSTSTAALDEAIRACSNFSSASDWIQSFLNECENYVLNNSYSSAYAFLNTVCGIDLTNSDTGAITGSDAGGASTKTAESIVPENSDVSYPTTRTTTIDGLTVIWPSGRLSSAEQLVIYGLNSWWINSALSLIEESYGMNFSETGTSVNTLQISFYNENSSTLASTSWNIDASGKATTLCLNINMYYYNAIQSDNYNGLSSTASSIYLDRLIAHELTHAVMAANITSMSELPGFLKEGLAELTQGIDDERTSTILSLCSNISTLTSALDLNSTSASSVYSYAAGYMALRYLAKNSTSSAYAGTNFMQSSSAYYDSSLTSLILSSSYTGSVWLNGWNGTTYVSSIKTLDATADSSTLILAGNNQENIIKAGTGTSSLWGGSGNTADTLIGGSGSNMFWYAEGDGSDVISGYSDATDTIQFYSGSITDVKVNGSDVVLQAGNGSLTVKDAAGSDLTVKTTDGTRYHAWIGKNAANTVTFNTDISFYYGSAAYTDTLKVTSGASIWLTGADGKYFSNIDNIDASTSTGTDVLAGNSGSNLIIGGSGTSSLWGGSGCTSDTLQGGSGIENFFYGAGDGRDYITNGSSADKVIFYSDITFNSIALDGTNLVISTSTDNTSVLTIANWSVSSLNTFVLANGQEWRLTQSGTTLGYTRIK